MDGRERVIVIEPRSHCRDRPVRGALPESANAG
jgi:hypothetical protein